MKKLFTIAWAALLLVGFFLVGKYTSTLKATAPEKTTICHCAQEDHCFTIDVTEQAYSGHFDAEGNPIHQGDHLGECSIEETDACTNIEGQQTSVPEDYYQTENLECFPKTPVCTDDSYANYGGEDGTFDPETEVSDNELCSDTPDVCPNLEGNQETLPEGYHYDEQRNCVPNETPEPTPPSCSGDQHLDASGTRCVSFEYGGPPAPGPATGGQVLGASTLAGTGSAEENLMTMVFVLGAISLGLGTMKHASKRV